MSLDRVASGEERPNAADRARVLWSPPDVLVLDMADQMGRYDLPAGLAERAGARRHGLERYERLHFLRGRRKI